MTNYEFTKAAQEKVIASWKKLQLHFGRELPVPKVLFDLRSKSCAGQAIGGHTIRLNLGYVREHAQDMLDRTVPHEAVHCWLVATRDPSHVRDSYNFGRRRTKRDVHGYTFQHTMHLLGADESRCHTMGKSDFARQSRTWAYKCPACGFVYHLSTVIHNKIQRGQRRYHTACGPGRGYLERVY
jgi:predicted SprT family Zn-dependent metalloprotease